MKKNSILYERGYVVLRANSNSDGLLQSATIAKVDSNFRVIEGTEKTIACDALAVGWGFTADLSIAGNLGLKQSVGIDGGLFVEVNERQETSVKGVFAAGEVTGIGGSDVAIIEGHIAGESASGVESSSKKLLQQRKRRENLAETLLRVYPIGQFWHERLTDETLICRCEEVSLGEIKSAIMNLEQRALALRNCFHAQGWVYVKEEFVVVQSLILFRKECGKPVSLSEQIAFASRPIVTPIPLGELARIGEIESPSLNH